MAKKTALITGISGQDGAYLAQFLLKKNYKVIGTDRRSARSNNWRLIELNIENKVILEDLDITEINNLIRIFQKYNIDWALKKFWTPSSNELRLRTCKRKTYFLDW